MEDLKENVDNNAVPPETIATPETEITDAGTQPAQADLLPETPAESSPKYSEAFRNRIKQSYPDQELTDDESFYQKASEQLDNLEAYRNKNMEANKALMEIIDAEPAVAEVLKDMIKGASFREALARHFSVEDLTPQPGAPDEEGWKKNAELRSKRLADNELANKTKAENDDFSMKAIQEFAKETGLEPEKADEFLSKVGEALDEVYSGKISKTFLNSMWRALNYDSDLESAKKVGEITGMNKKIDVDKNNKKVGDGMPVVAGNGTPAPEKKPGWLDNLVNNEKKKQIL